MYEPDAVWTAARDIRPHLPQLVGPGWEDVDGEIGRLLDQVDAGQNADDTAVLVALRRHERAREWLAERLGQSLESLRSYSEVPGISSPIVTTTYVCPTSAHYTWHRPFVGVPIPLCPSHKVRLVLAEPG